MKIAKQISAFCPYCNKHTPHSVKLYSKKPQRGNSVGNRRHNRKIKGYVGKVKAETPKKKLAKRQKAVLECATCHKKIERVFGNRTKKKLELKTG